MFNRVAPPAHTDTVLVHQSLGALFLALFALAECYYKNNDANGSVYMCRVRV